jgi:beta-N-acetylhexosaminidase
VIEAGCDVALHCSGEFAEMVETARAVPLLAGLAAERFARARSFFHAPLPFDRVDAMALVSEAAGTPVA